MSATVVVGGSLAQRPYTGGHAWQFLEYLLGFRRLGWDVLFLDRLDQSMCFDAAGQPCSVERSSALRYFFDVMAGFGLKGAYALLTDAEPGCIGMTRRRLLERVRDSALLFNIMGFIDDEEILAAAPMRVFFDTDPGYGQMWRELGLHDPFRGHDVYVTIGENIGKPACLVPTCGMEWITTPQPVVLEQWPRVKGGTAFTSVGSWRGGFGPLEYKGRTYGLRVHEFRKFVEVPRRTGRRFELALDIHEAEVRDRDLLLGNAWSLIDPVEVARDPWVYRTYLQSSAAEFMVAKGMYVGTQAGWFSDRSMCYLASGKPVLAQDTGLDDLYPVGEGLVTFRTVEEAVDGVEKICGDYDRHARAARALAVEYFDSDKVLSRLLGRLGIA